MEVNDAATADDLWTPYKELVSVVEGYLAHEGDGAPYAVHTFESVLRRHKQTFLSLMKNPTKNATSREEIKKGITEGVILPSIGKTLLSKELVDEAIILSDMYNVNEYLTLELLHTAQRQRPRHPTLARGLIAVLLYYDGRRAVATALKSLFMAMDGVSWSIKAREEVIQYVTRYVEQLVSDGVLGRALDVVRGTSLAQELDLLQRNRALPPRGHHARLLITIESTRKLLAGVIFAASAQRGLDRDFLLRLITEETQGNIEETPPPLDEVSLALQMALLYALDLSVLHRREDGEELVKRLPLLKDVGLIEALIEKLLPPAQQDRTHSESSSMSGARALCRLALGLALAAFKRAPQSLLRAERAPSADLLDNDEALVDAAIDGRVFEYLDSALLSSEFVCKEEYYQLRIHTLITDFIVLMHSKLMEMRVKSEEWWRAGRACAAEGVRCAGGAGGGAGLAALLRCVERLYARDPRRLRDDYWRAADHYHLGHGGGGAGLGAASRAATLYKFVRLSGEVVAAPLLAGYLRALASLAAPRHTWALLAARDALSAHHLLTALHRYYTSLRSERSSYPRHPHAASLGASALVTPAARPARLLVRHEEVEAMTAALKLIAGVAREDPAACAVLCENPHWDAINCMFGLMCCHVPLQLKAELCSTLAALGSAPPAAARVWAALESAQLVVAAPDKRALYAELTEVECRAEEYPLSRAFLSLLIALCGAAPLPRALGAGSRAPALAPYVDYVIARLATPAPRRPYARQAEKWQILSLCFRLLGMWVELSEVTPSSLAGAEPPPPGLAVLLHMHTDSELLRLVLGCVDEALDLLDTHPLPGKQDVIECVEGALRLCSLALAAERGVSAAAAAAPRPVPVVGLSHLLLTSASGGGAQLVSWCRAVGCAGAAAGVAARAVAALLRALASPAAQRHLLAVAAADTARADTIRHCFVECLEAEDWPGADVGADGVAEPASEGDQLRCAKQGVLALLLQSLPTAAPNFAQFLLGYQISDDVSGSNIQDAGVGGAPRTCLHAVLDILDAHIARHTADREASELVEQCYRLVYWVCARPATSAPALRYLRTRARTLADHLKATVNLENASARTISARSWVLRACACEVGAAAGSRRRAALAASLAAALDGNHRRQEWEGSVLRECVRLARVRVAPAPEPRWELFSAHHLRRAIDACDLPTGGGGRRISVSRVHAALARELAALPAAAPQRAQLNEEIQKVLDYVTEVNRLRNLAATLTHYYDSWRQLAEIIFCSAPHDMLPLETRKNLILDILQELLAKITPADVLPQLGNLASGTVLLLLVNLRHCYLLQKRDSDMKLAEFETTFFGDSSAQMMQSKSLTLKFILHKILNWILVSGGSTMKMRVNLYGSLLNYLNIINLKINQGDADDGNCTYVSRLDSSKFRLDKEESSLKAMVVDVISGFGDKLCAIVCGDCIGAGHDVCRMVALSCLSTLIDIDPRTDWMDVFIDQGYFRSLIDSLQQDDEGLLEALEPSPKTLRALYAYESKMALIIKMAGARGGGERALEHGVLGRLAALRALRTHPDLRAYDDAHDDFVPSVAHRFRQILVPAMALCDALLTSLGADNQSCAEHVHHFLRAHIECIDLILRSAHPSSGRGLLSEAASVAGVCARAGPSDATPRLRCLMLALLGRFQHPPNACADDDTNALYDTIVCYALLHAWRALEGGAGSVGGEAGEASAARRLAGATMK